MKKTLVILAIILLVISIFANNPPDVQNVEASKRTDRNRIVDIYYDVKDADGTIYKWNTRKFTEKVKGNILKKGKRS